MKNNIKKEWYDNPDILTTVILSLAIVIVVISQAMAVNSEVDGMVMLRNLFNHNFTYIAAIIYFALLKTNLGKRNFNIINVFYIVLYTLNMIASVFTIFQSFSLVSIINMVLNVLIVCYMIFTFLRDTRIWKDFALDKLPFDQVKNDWYFHIVCLFSLAVLLLNLIEVNVFNEIVTTIFDTVFVILFSRYIYLYKEYTDKNRVVTGENIKKKKSDKDGK